MAAANGSRAAMPEAHAPSILTGYKRYNAVCSHCHGPDGLGGAFAPTLVDRLPDWPDFRAAVAAGVGARMPGYDRDPNVAPFLNDIYAYLRARADGSVGRGRPPG